MTKKKWKKAGIRCFLIISALLVMWGGIGVQTGSAEVMEEEEPVEKRTAGETDQWNFDYMDIEEAWDLIDRPAGKRGSKKLCYCGRKHRAV